LNFVGIIIINIFNFVFYLFAREYYWSSQISSNLSATEEWRLIPMSMLRKKS